MPLRALLGLLLLTSPVRAQDSTGVEDERSYVWQLSDRAVLAARDGRDAEAHRLLTEAGHAALSLPNDDPQAPFVLANWAQLRLSDGRWESAEAIALSARDRASAVGDDDVALRVQRILVECRRLLGRLDEAEADLAAAREQLRTRPGDAAEVAELRYSQALLELDLGRPAGALAPLDRILAAAGEREPTDLEFRARLARSEALLALRDEDEAEAELQRAEGLARDPRQRADVLQVRALARQRQGQNALARHHVDAMLGEASRWISSASDAAGRRNRGRVSRGYFETALNVVWPQRNPATAPADEETWAAADEWLRRLHGLHRGAITGEALHEHRVLWFWGTRDVVAWTRLAGQSPTVRRCGDPEQLREWILLFRSLLADPTRADERNQVGTWLVNALFGGEPPAAGTLRLQTDGPLNALPFALLPTEVGPLGVSRPLVQGADNTGARAPDDGTSGELLIIADPLLTNGAAALPALPGALREAQAVAARVPGARVVTGAAAMEARIMGTLSPAVLHVAAHSSPDPEDAALLLAPGDGQDGRLTTDEVRRLAHVPQIVVLSTCESLLSDVSGRSSTGDVGLAFLEAGAATVLGALWRIDDRTPAALMASFHSHVQRGARPSEALRRARSEALGSGAPETSDPFVWGAFVVSGRDAPLVLPEPPPKENRGPEAAVGFASALAFAALLGWARRRGT